MHIVTTHKSADFDALASVVAANLLYPDVVAVLPATLNHNVRSFLSLHRGLFDFCTPEKINLDAVDKLTVVDTNHWDRLDRMDPLKAKQGLEIILFDHHGNTGNIEPTWQCSEEMGANITLMLRYLKRRQRSMTPIQASLFLAGLYEDTGNLTFPSTRAEDAHAAGFLLEKGADLNVLNAFISPVYGRNQKDVLFSMLQNAKRILLGGYTVSINRVGLRGYVSNLAVVVQMYRQILNVDAAFGVFALEGDRCLVIGRSNTAGINVASIMRHMGGGGHPGAGSAMLKSATAASVEKWIRVLIGQAHRSCTRIQDLMSSPVLTLPSDMSMQRAGIILRERGCHGAPVVENGKLVGILSLRDYDKIKKKNQLRRPVKAFMSTDVVTISKNDSPGHAAHLMVKNDIGRLPVVDNGRVVGIFSRSDAVADFYGMCPIGRKLSTGCSQNEIALTPSNW